VFSAIAARGAVILCACASASSAADAESAASRYASAQLAAAEAQIDLAERAVAHGDYALARRFVEQAALDARLTWSMTEFRRLRNAAVEVNKRVIRVKGKLDGISVAGR